MALVSLHSKTVQLFLFLFGVLLVGTAYLSFRDYAEYAFLTAISNLSTRKVWAKHAIRQDGLLETNMAGRHPLLDLIEDGERRWDEMNARHVMIYVIVP